MQEWPSSERRTSRWHMQCLGASCLALLRPMDTLNPVSFKNKKNRRRKRGRCWAFSHKSPEEWVTLSMSAASMVREQIQRCHTVEGPEPSTTCVKSHWDYGERDGMRCFCPALQPQVNITQPLRMSFGSLPLVWIPSWMAGLQTFVSDNWLRLISCFVFCPSRMGFPSTFCNKIQTESILYFCIAVLCFVRE